MKIAISATNPCHLYPLARELAKLQCLDCYYSGYPRWKLQDAERLHIRTHSLRTNIVYGLLKFFPKSLRPDTRDMFLWQDRGFDEWVGRHLGKCDFIHAMPGQSLHIFRKAKALGIGTVMNHATGPVREWVRIMEPEYCRAGLKLEEVCPYDRNYFEREDREYTLADFHCVASTIVRDQLINLGIDHNKLWVVPYGADRTLFFQDETPAPTRFTIVFAGQIGLRKGLKTLLDSLELSQQKDWQVELFGTILDESKKDMSDYHGKPELKFHGAVSQSALAHAFRGASVLVLPSLEEGFGLVVPQALNSGLPCIVSERVGAKDLIRHHENGSIFKTQNPESLLNELLWWEARKERPVDQYEWWEPAEKLLTLSKTALSLS